MRTVRFPFALVCLLLTTLGTAQTPTFNERYDADGTGDQLFGVVTTDYGYIGIGNSVNPNTLQTGRLWLFGIDYEGELLWQRTYFPDSVTIQPGWSNSPERLSDGNLVTPVRELRPLSGVRLLHIMKFNDQGDSLWSCSYECPPGKWYLSYAARETSDGGIVSVGSTDDHFQAPTYRPFAMKCDAEGNLLWFRQYSSPTFSTTITSVVATDDGGGIMGGQVNWSWGEALYFLLRFDADGNEVWRTVYDYEGLTSAAHLAKFGSEYYVSTILKIGGSSSSIRRPYFARFSPNTGNLIWEGDFASCELCFYTAIFAVDVDSEGNIVGGGHIQFPDEEAQWSFQNGYLIKVTDEGEFLWHRHYAFAEQTECIFRDLRVTEDGGIVAAGHAGNNDEYPSYDGWVIKTDEHGCIVPGCHVGVLENEATAAFKLYPNPARDIVNLYLETDQSRPRGTITIHDLQGREVKNFPAPQNETTYIIDISMLPAGLYVVSYSDGEVRFTERLVVGE